MRPAALIKSCVAPLGVALLIAATVGTWEGLPALRWLLNVPGWTWTVGATAVLLWSAYPLREICDAVELALGARHASSDEGQRAARLLRHASRCAAGAGLLGGFLWLLILLWTVSEADEVPQRLTLALSPWFFGLLLAKTLFDRSAEFTHLSHRG